MVSRVIYLTSCNYVYPTLEFSLVQESFCIIYG